MLDMKWIREHQEQVQAVVEQKGMRLSIAELLQWDDKRRVLLVELEQLRQERNRVAQAIQDQLRAGDVEQADKLKQQGKDISAQLKVLEESYREAEEQCQQRLLLVPNVVSPDTPIGRSDADNVEIKRVGELPAFGFRRRDHIELGELHDMIDIPPRGEDSGHAQLLPQGRRGCLASGCAAVGA